jgi:hypothetical protein
MRLKVDAYSGYTGNERPLRFTLGKQTVSVTEILDRWYGEGERYFRVAGDDGNIYVLKYLGGADCWELASFTRKGSQGTGPELDRVKIVH